MNDQRPLSNGRRSSPPAVEAKDIDEALRFLPSERNTLGVELELQIIDPHTGQDPDGVLSFTVVGPKLSAADAYATAAYAMGRNGINWIAGLAGLAGYAGCMITAERRRVWTPEFARYAATF